jgi:hypothetical protein
MRAARRTAKVTPPLLLRVVGMRDQSLVFQIIDAQGMWKYLGGTAYKVRGLWSDRH